MHEHHKLDSSNFELNGAMNVLDPVCGMTVLVPGKGHANFQGKDYYFCSEKCLHKFEAAGYHRIL